MNSIIAKSPSPKASKTFAAAKWRSRWSGVRPLCLCPLRWRCPDCGYIKHVTRPMPAEVAPPGPKCGGKSFLAVS